MATDNTILYHESGRPQFHFTARRNVLNAPNGLVYCAGEYHMFFQHNPMGKNWGNMTWGHAVSTDLVTWRQLDNAIEPDRLGTIYSGSAVVDHDNTSGFQTGSQPCIVAIYTAAGGSSAESQGRPFTQCIAFSNDLGRTWTKYSDNPVLPHVVGENRDPKVIWYEQGKVWVMVLFLDIGSFGLFTSPDLKHWSRIQTVSLPDSSECPDIFPMTVEGASKEERWIITAANGHYLVGRFDGKEFTDICGPFTMDFGANFYAGQTFSDIPSSDGRRIQIGWLAGGVYPDMPFNQQMSFPVALSLRETSDGLRVFRYPIAEINELVDDVHEWSDLTLEPGDNPLSSFSSDLLDIELEAEPTAESILGFRIGDTEVRYSAEKRTITCLGRSHRCEGDPNDFTIRILVDRASIEIFADDGRTAMSFCVTPSSSETPLEIYAEGSSVHIPSLQVRKLKSAWAETISE